MMKDGNILLGVYLEELGTIARAKGILAEAMGKTYASSTWCLPKTFRQPSPLPCAVSQVPQYEPLSRGRSLREGRFLTAPNPTNLRRCSSQRRNVNDLRLENSVTGLTA